MRWLSRDRDEVDVLVDVVVGERTDSVISGHVDSVDELARELSGLAVSEIPVLSDREVEVEVVKVVPALGEAASADVSNTEGGNEASVAVELIDR